MSDMKRRWYAHNYPHESVGYEQDGQHWGMYGERLAEYLNALENAAEALEFFREGEYSDPSHHLVVAFRRAGDALARLRELRGG